MQYKKVFKGYSNIETQELPPCKQLDTECLFYSNILLVRFFDKEEGDFINDVYLGEVCVSSEGLELRIGNQQEHMVLKNNEIFERPDGLEIFWKNFKVK